MREAVRAFFTRYQVLLFILLAAVLVMGGCCSEDAGGSPPPYIPSWPDADQGPTGTTCSSLGGVWQGSGCDWQTQDDMTSRVTNDEDRAQATQITRWVAMEIPGKMSCTARCSQEGLHSALTEEGETCTSAETGGSIITQYPSSPSEWWYCYKEGGVADFDTTDRVTSCYCEGEISPDVACCKTIDNTRITLAEIPDQMVDEDAAAWSLSLAGFVQGNTAGLRWDAIYGNPELFEYTLAQEGAVTFTPVPDANGQAYLTIIASNKYGQSAVKAVKVFISPVPDAPVITSIPPRNTAAGEQYQYQIEASDVDSTAFAYTLDERPASMLISTGGLITWIPEAGRQGTSVDITVRVSDEAGESTTQGFTIQIF